ATSASRRSASAASRTSAPRASPSCSSRTPSRRPASSARAPRCCITGGWRSTARWKRPGSATASSSAVPRRDPSSRRRIAWMEAPAGAITRRTGAGALVEALRPRQWTKNVFVFAGLVFGGRLFDPASILRELAAFAIFCAAASAVYLANDVADREYDALHPLKRTRPIASGRLSVQVGLGGSAALAAVSLLGSAAISRELLWIVLAYLGTSLAYSFGLKRVYLLDVMIVALGFVLRAAAGAAAVRVEISPWL